MDALHSTTTVKTALPPSYTQRDLQRLHRRATQLIASASGTTTSRFSSSSSASSASSSSKRRHHHHYPNPLTTPGPPLPPSTTLPSASATTATPVLTSLQHILDDMRDSMQHSLNERKQIHADALELAEAESRDLYDSVVAAQARASSSEEQLKRANIKLEEYRENTGEASHLFLRTKT